MNENSAGETHSAKRFLLDDEAAANESDFLPTRAFFAEGCCRLAESFPYHLPRSTTHTRPFQGRILA